MHEQIRTSPSDGEGPDEGLSFQDRLRGRLTALASVNIEGVAPELASTHVRFAFRDAAMRDAMDALAPWQPTVHDAITIPVGNHPGGLRGILDAIVEADFEVESVLVLSTDVGPDVLVSVGVNRPASIAEWRALGGYDDPDEMPPG